MKKAKPKKITQMDVIKSIRRPVPPPSVLIESKKTREATRPKHKKRITPDSEGD
ncbi:MAG TPA: hypothetical protein VFC63_10050 [Blastocatellia bacterium]|nr:hypothetical protein [Blastocatellia bacterium]